MVGGAGGVLSTPGYLRSQIRGRRRRLTKEQHRSATVIHLECANDLQTSRSSEGTTSGGRPADGTPNE